MKPSHAHEAGDPLRGTGRTYDTCGWYLDSAPEIEEGVELAESLGKLLDRVESAAAALWALEGEGYRITWPCILGSHRLEHSVELDRRMLQRLLALPGDLWLDVYEAIPDDLDAAASLWSGKNSAECDG